MNLPIHVQKIEVFYDGRCGMCCTFHEWIQRQKRAFGIDFLPYQSDEAERVFPGLHTLDPAREMIVRTDDGTLYRGAEAWVWCLYSCSGYRGLAKRLARPAMLAVAIRVCRLLAANRHGLSKIFFRKKDREVRETLHQMPSPECPDGACDFERDEWRNELMH
ncbi:MAG: DCC1-like thiol-disulfide oxidoreductase family protein [Akkermansiaceae bacterium]|jgi:predicted DCC family thiol-disulfide oxidoreductase YuxK